MVWHLLFATEEQLFLLYHSKHWCVDATFEIVLPAVTHLFSIHTTVQSGKKNETIVNVCNDVWEKDVELANIYFFHFFIYLSSYFLLQ